MARTVFLDEPPAGVTDITDIAAWLERRRALGQDLYDEVWEGAYHVAPILHSRHGFVVAQVGERLGPRARRVGLWPVGAVNIGLSEHDFRVPDYAVVRGRDDDLYLPTAAVAVEVGLPGDESYQKFGFYFAHGEEVLIVDPQRRTVDWYGRGADAFARSGRSALLGVDEASLHEEIDWPPN